jgi:hypothetical protein
MGRGGYSGEKYPENLSECIDALRPRISSAGSDSGSEIVSVDSLFSVSPSCFYLQEVNINNKI